jgi:Zn-finger nucleic acid-binding protein
MCRGVWLDRGELEKIVERFTMVQHDYGYEDRPRRPYEPPQGGHYYKKKKTKSLLGELFDF